MACSHIAVRLRHPASTPVTARDNTVGRSRRTPRLLRGLVMLLRTWIKGWRDKAFVVEAGISAAKGLIKHHSPHRPHGAHAPAPATHHPHQSGSPPHPPTLDPLTRGRVPYEVLVEVENPAR